MCVWGGDCYLLIVLIIMSISLLFLAAVPDLETYWRPAF